MTSHPADAGSSDDVPPTSTFRRILRRSGIWLARASVVGLGLLHGGLIWAAMGGREGVSNDWPPLRVDHGIHYHQGAVTRHFLTSTGTTAGYDPDFMSGYAASIVSDLSSTLPDLVMLFFPSRPALAYKLYVFGCAALTPWLIAAAAMIWRPRPWSVALAVLVFLVYFWTAGARVSTENGMMSYVLSVPLALLTVAALTAYLSRGGTFRWLLAASACSAVFLVHLTSPLIVAPAGMLAYLVAVVGARRKRRPMPVSRHVGFWAIGPVVLVANAFWLVPGYLLTSTKGTGLNAFSHPEPVLGRIWEIVAVRPPIEAAVIGLGLIGIAGLARRDPVAASGLGGVMAAGFAWGYLAGFSRVFDPLEPGRHTYVFFAASSIAAGIGLGTIMEQLSASLRPWVVVGVLLFGTRIFGETIEYTRDLVVRDDPFLSSRPTTRLLWFVNRLRAHVAPGERLLFEESGRGMIGIPDPFEGRHYSPVLPQMAGVEVIGGPFLHVTVTTNFTQFGEGKLFEMTRWGRDEFVRYAKVYGPTAIACWSPNARAFCRENPDLVRIVADDGKLMLGRVLGFEGKTSRGTAEVKAGPNRIEVRNAIPGDDGLVVLRYHAVPNLKIEPHTSWEPVFLENDPVPFIGIRPVDGTSSFDIHLSPWSRTR